MLKSRAIYVIALSGGLFASAQLGLSQPLVPKDAVQVVLSSYRVNPPAWVYVFKNVSNRKITAFGARISVLDSQGNPIATPEGMMDGAGVDLIEQDAKLVLKKNEGNSKPYTFGPGDSYTQTVFVPTPPPAAIKVFITSVILDDDTAFGDENQINFVFQRRARDAAESGRVLQELKARISGDRIGQPFEPQLREVKEGSRVYQELNNFENILHQHGLEGLKVILPYYEAKFTVLDQHKRRSN